MADTKISDLSAISSVDVSDEFPIVDKSDTTQASSGSTKKGTVQNLKDYFDGQYAAIGSVYGPTRIISESHQFISGMTFKVYNVTWINAGTQYTNNFNENVVISDGDDYYPRKDIVVLDLDDDTLDVVEGEAVAAIAAEPALLPNQLRLFVVDVPTGATSLAGITTVTMYDEAVDEYGGEWDVVGTGTVDTASTDDSSNGLYSIKFPTGTISQFATLSVASPVTVSALAIGFKFKQPSAHNYKFNVILYNTEENTVYPYVTVEGDNYGLDSSSTDWQEVFISFPSITTFDQLRFVNLRNNSLIYFDEVEYQTGLPAAEVTVFLPTGGYTGTAQDIVDSIGSTAPTLSTGTTITFTTNTLYNSASPLTSGALTLDLTSAVTGVFGVVYCDGYFPAISGEDYKILVDNRNTDTLNELWFWYDGTRINLSIVSTTQLTAPTLTLTPEDLGMGIDWNTIVNADNYVVERSTDNFATAGTQIYSGALLTYTDSGLTNGTTYYYRIKAQGAGYDESEWSTVASAIPVEFNYTTSLVAAYEFESDFNDYLGTHNATPTGMTYTTGKVGNCGVFDGSTSFGEITDSTDFSFTDGAGNDTAFTIAFWMYWDVKTGIQMFFEKRDGTSNAEYYIFSNGTDLICHLCSGGNQNVYIRNSVPVSGFSTATWYRCVVTYDGSEANTGITWYVNGVAQSDNLASSGTYTGMSNTSANLLIGNDYTDTYFFDGRLDEVYIYKGLEWASDQVSDDYTQQNAGTATLP